MRKNKIKLIYKASLLCLLISTFSCKKIFDVKPVDAVDATNAYQNIYDANAAVIGIYGQFMSLADRYVVLNELRADLMSPTANADVYLNQLNTHTETTDNPWTDPKPWYKVILACNDAMYHFNDMLATGKLKPIDYQARYSDIGALRCWLYLQVATQYGTIPYVTDPLSNLTDLNDATKFPRITLDQLIPKLAAFMNDPARYLDFYPTSDPITGSTSTSLNLSVDATATNIVFINKYAVKADINLWAGNYNLASSTYRILTDYGTAASGFNNASENYYEQYKVTSYQNNGSSQSGGLGIAYGSSETSLTDNQTNGWRQIFSNPTVVTDLSMELLWRIPFNTTFGPTDPFIDLFANVGGSYKLTASQVMLDNWNTQVQTNGYPYDARGKIAVRTINGQVVIAKPLYYYLNNTTFQPVSTIQKPGYWLLYRTAAMQNHFAEAAVNDNQVKFAYALITQGVKLVYAPNPYPSDPTNVSQTFLPPPYDVDARLGGPQNWHGTWYREGGTRSRALLTPLPASIYLNNDKITMENEILQEDARELSFEGYRWGDLVRVARRRGDASVLAQKVYQKLLREGNPAAPAVLAKLSDPNGWYMPFKF